MLEYFLYVIYSSHVLGSFVHKFVFSAIHHVSLIVGIGCQEFPGTVLGTRATEGSMGSCGSTEEGTSISYLLLYNKLSQKIPFIISQSFCGSGIVGWLFLGGFGMSCLVRLRLRCHLKT